MTKQKDINILAVDYLLTGGSLSDFNSLLTLIGVSLMIYGVHVLILYKGGKKPNKNSKSELKLDPGGQKAWDWCTFNFWTRPGISVRGLHSSCGPETLRDS